MFKAGVNTLHGQRGKLRPREAKWRAQSHRARNERGQTHPEVFLVQKPMLSVLHAHSKHEPREQATRSYALYVLDSPK